MPAADGDPARRLDLELDTARLRGRSPGWSSRGRRAARWSASTRTSARCWPAGRSAPASATTRPPVRRAARRPGRDRPTSSRSAPRTSPGWSPTRAPTGGPRRRRAALGRPRPGPRAAHRRRRAAADRPARPAAAAPDDPARSRWPTPSAPGTPWPPASSRGLLAEQVTDRAALEALDDDRLAALVDDAALVAALTCTRVGRRPADAGGAHPGPRGRDPVTHPATAPWWRSAVIYQVYIRSFADGDGDGIGDIAGLRSRLPYLADLGVDALWINPWYPSPMADARLRRRRLPRRRAAVRHAGRRRGAARARRTTRGPAGAARHRAQPHLRPARVVPGGAGGRPRLAGARALPLPPRPRGRRRPAAQRLAQRLRRPGLDPGHRARRPPGEWYLHLFAPEQPDLNWANPEVRADFERDAAVLVRPRRRRLPDRRRPRAGQGGGAARPRRPRRPVLAPRPTAAADAPALGPRRGARDLPRAGGGSPTPTPTPRVFVAEAWVDDPGAAGPLRAPRRAAHRVQLRLPPRPVGGRTRCAPTIDDDPGRARRRRARPRPGCCPTTTSPGTSSRYGRDAARRPACALDDLLGQPVDLELGTRRARAAALLMLALPGGAYVYQGEELGLPEVEDLPDDVAAGPDVGAVRAHAQRGRDGCRVPIPWSGTSRRTASARRGDGAAVAAAAGGVGATDRRGAGGRPGVDAGALPGGAAPAARAAGPRRRAAATWLDGRARACSPSPASPASPASSTSSADAVPLPECAGVLLASGRWRRRTAAADTAVWLATGPS